MPEDTVETQALQANPKWMFHLALSTALVAVLAAIASLQAGSLANRALLIKNEAVLSQAQASDQWASYQAKGIKGLLYEIESDSANSPYMARKYNDEAKRSKSDQARIKAQADEIEKKVAEANAESSHLQHHHHRLTLAVTLFQVSIALAAIAALTGRKELWYLGMLLAIGGLVFFFRGWM